MTNTDLEMFMAKLRMLVYDPASTGNNQFIEAKRPEIGFLYGELSYLYAIGIRFKDTTIGEEQLHGLEEVGNLTRRLFKAVQEAEDIVDMFISSAIIKNDVMAATFNYHLKSAYLTMPSERSFTQRKLTYSQQQDHVFIEYIFNRSLQDLKDVVDGLKSIREEIMSNYYNDRGDLLQNLLVNQQEMMMMMMDNKIAATGTTVNLSATEHEEFIVGFDDDALLILDRLTGDRKKLDIISIVGMGGLGKTTLATKIFNDSLVEYYFDIRGWVNVSQAYSKRDMLVKLLASIGKSVHAATSESKLCETLYQSLKGRKYLIVIDDIWSCKSWDDVAPCFPDDKTGSRVLVATRLTEVASHTSQGGFTHNLRLLTEEQSWELLCRKTFRGYECPESLIETGKHIAKKCGGLPLAIVVIAGLLEKGEKRKDLWEKIAESVGSYIVNDPKGCLDTLALSYDHLPCHLKKCFLYVGGFPEDYEVRVQTLIRLWMAEGFIKESGQRSLEEEGKSYLMDLIDRNLLIVAEKSSNGGVKSCRLHDLLRHLCLKKADEINFFKKVSTSALGRNPDSDSVSRVVKQRRLFTDKDVLTNIYSRYFPTHTRSVLCFDDRGLLEHKTASWIPSFLLLRVLDLLNIPMFKFSKIRMLVHLRYLAVWVCDHDSSFLNANFLSLETLIVKGNSQSLIYPSENIVHLRQLPKIRHLRCDGITIPRDFTVPTLSNLQTISRLILDHGTYLLLKCFPDIKKLGCSVCSTSSKDGRLSFSMLTHLEALNIYKYRREPLTLSNPIRFPETLKKLTLKGLCLPWNYMSTIQRLPKLEVLKLLDSSFTGYRWETGDEQFHQLKYLKLTRLNIRVWEASSINFPSLRKLAVRSCKDLREIPLVLGNISTLEYINIDSSNSRVLESVNRIQNAQRDIGNYDIHVSITHMDQSEVFFEGDPYFCKLLPKHLQADI